MPPILSKEVLEHTWSFHDDGRVTWNHKHKKVNPGDEAGCLSSYGYKVVTYKGYQYKVHRLVYAYHTGDWPRLVDHINQNRTDNRIENLRSISISENLTNTNKTTGRSKYRGVSFHRGRARALIQSKGNREFLGYFGTEEQASKVYMKRREELNPGLLGEPM